MVTKNGDNHEADPPPDSEGDFGTFAPHPYHSMDSDGEIITVNDAWLDTVGYDHDEVEGQWFGDFLPNVSETEFNSTFRTYKDTGRVSDLEYEMKCADGETIVVSFDGTVEYDDNGEFVRAHCQFTEITERKRREQDLRQFKQAVGGSTDLLGAADMNENILFVNEQYRKYHSLTAGEATGKSLEEILGEEVFADIEPYLERVYEGENVSYEMERPGPDGDARTLDIQYYPLRDENGDIYGSVTAMRDITERKERERELRDLYQTYRGLFDGINDAVFVHEPAGTFLEVNEEVIDRLGYDEDELLELTPEDIDAPDHAPNAGDRIETIEAEGTHTFESVHVTESGERIPVDVSSSIIDYFGDSAILSVARDITERKKQERRLETYRQSVEKSIDLMAAADADLNLLFANQKYQEYHDLVGEDIRGKSLDGVLGKHRFERVRPHLERVLEGETIEYEMERTGPNGEPRTLDIRYYPLRDEAGTVHGGAAAMRDITEQKQYIESVQRLSEYRRVMSEVNQRLVRTTDIADMMKSVTEILSSSDLFACSFIGLTDGAAVKTVFESGSGLSISKIKSFHSTEYIESVLEESPLVVDDVTQPPFSHYTSDGAPHPGVAMAIRGQEDEYGVVTVYFPSDSTPDDDDIELVGELADDLGFFLRNRALEREGAETRRVLQQSEVRYRNLFEQSLNGISIHEIITNENGNPVDYVYQEVNPAFEQMTGLSSDDVTGKRATDVFPEREYGPFINKFGQVALENETVAFEAYFDPLEIHVAIKAFPLKDGRFVMTFTDITKRVERESELQEFQRAVEASGHAIYMTDKDGTITYVNPAFEDITGFDREEALGETPRILKSGEMPEEHYEELWETILAGDNWTEEVINRRKNGELYSVHQTIAPITDDVGEISGFVAIQTDISDLKEMEKNLEERTRQLSIMDRVLRHNLRNDLNIIEGFAKLIRDGSSGEPKTQSEKILDVTDQLLHTADKQRDLTQLLINPPPLREIDISRVVREATTAIQDRYPYAGISVSAPESAPVKATSEIRQAIEELLGNAVAYSDQSVPSVEVRVNEAEEKPKITIEVADDGPGIPEMEKEVLLNEESIDPLYHGSGLGLRLVNVIVSQSEGELLFDVNEPNGSVVKVVLDRAE